MTDILVADDELDILDSTQMVLSRLGFRVTTVDKAPRILPTLRRLRPDLLLQDVYMPGLNLENLVADIRADPALHAVRLLVFTASTEGDEICQRVKADGFIRKPFDADSIKETLQRYLTAPVKGGR